MKLSKRKLERLKMIIGKKLEGPQQFFVCYRDPREGYYHKNEKFKSIEDLKMKKGLTEKDLLVVIGFTD